MYMHEKISELIFKRIFGLSDARFYYMSKQVENRITFLPSKITDLFAGTEVSTSVLYKVIIKTLASSGVVLIHIYLCIF